MKQLKGSICWTCSSCQANGLLRAKYWGRKWNYNGEDFFTWCGFHWCRWHCVVPEMEYWRWTVSPGTQTQKDHYYEDYIGSLHNSGALYWFLIGQVFACKADFIFLSRFPDEQSIEISKMEPSLSLLEIVVRLTQNLLSGLILLDSNLCSSSEKNHLPHAISLSSCILFITTLVFF